MTIRLIGVIRDARLTPNNFVTFLFSSTLFLSASLLFSAQPLIAKMLLPSLGGAPAVWNTCMVFFQIVLLTGYTYGHFLTNRRRKIPQVTIHFILVLLASAFLPLDLASGNLLSLQNQSNPVLAVLILFAAAIGLPILIVSTSAPMLQKWYSRTGHPSAADPYFLYSASNAGSLVALLAYPTLIEPNLVLQQQSRFWSLGFLLFVFLTALCAAVRWKTSPRIGRRERGDGDWCPVRSDQPDNPIPSLGGDFAPTAKFQEDVNPENRPMRDSIGLGTDPAAPISQSGATPGIINRLRWTVLACVPSSLMLGLTTYITTDIASAPLFWVVPLALYLLTFILAFAKRSIISYRHCERILPIGALAVIYLLLSQATQPVWLVLGAHLFVFFVAGLACHGRLAAERPPAKDLTEFYFWISFGGVLGGLFNTLVAPLLFTQILEYPVMIALACGLRPGAVSNEIGRKHKGRLEFKILPTLLPGLLAGVAGALLVSEFSSAFQLRAALVYGIPLVVGFFLVDIPWRFALALAGVLVGSSFNPDGHGETLYATRNFFGLLRITKDPSGPFRRLVHGSTLHGRQFIDPARQCDPLSYYHRSGPLHDIFKVSLRTSGCTNVAVIGLGAGSTACFSRPHQAWSFYEINPAVVEIARNTNFFSHLTQCLAAKNDVVLGDARLRLREAQASRFELMILDAFSSDSIPAHLITREAIELYLSKLAPNGILAFHISNRSLDLAPVLGDLAAHLELVCYSFNETELHPHEIELGKDASHWLVMARNKEHLGNIPRYDPWIPVAPRPDPEIWTDSFSNILGALNWW